MNLLDYIQQTYGIKTDRELAAKIGLSTPVVSRIRNGKCGVSGDVMIKIHEVFDMPIKQIKELCLNQES